MSNELAFLILPTYLFIAKNRLGHSIVQKIFAALRGESAPARFARRQRPPPVHNPGYVPVGIIL